VQGAEIGAEASFVPTARSGFQLGFQHRDRALDYQHSVSMGKTDPSSRVEAGAGLARFRGLFAVRNANVLSN